METKSAPLSKNPGGYCWEFLVGGAALFSKSWPYFRPKNVIFHTRFQTWGLFLEIKVPVTLRARNQIFKSKYKE